MKSPKSTFSILSLLVLVTCFAPHLFGQPAQDAVPDFSVARPLIAGIDETQLITLKGNTRPEARAKNDQGRVSADLPMGDLVLVLRRGPEQQAAFDAFVESQYDSSSPNFHHWLTPEEVGEKFGPAQPDLDAVTNWLSNHGFSIDDVSKNRLSIRFSGTASKVESAFHTEIHNLLVKRKDGTLESHIANMSDPQIPEGLTPVVVGVKALHNFFPRPMHKLGGVVHRDAETGKWRRETAGDTPWANKPVAGVENKAVKPSFTVNDPNNGLVEDVTPYDFAAIYNVLPLWNAATPIDGTGQTIAIAGTSNINLADVATFRSTFGLPAKVPTVIITNTDPGDCPTAASTCDGDLTENSLDVEWSGAVAKNANIVLVTSSATTASTDNLYLSEDYIVQHKTAPIMNVSYGECELFVGTAGNVEYNTLWQTAASEGIAVFVSTGDSGAPACDDGGDEGGANLPYLAEYGLSVSGLASTPYNTAVGGTDLNWCSTTNLLNGACTALPYWTAANTAKNASAVGYIPEIPWNDTCTSPVGLAYMEYVASGSATGFGGVSDTESACNFVLAYYQIIYEDYGQNLSGWVDTVGGSGGKSSCTVNSTTSSTANPLPSSCSGGYAKPAWQTGVTGIPADGKRDIPDISFFASNGFLGSAYLICVSANGSCIYLDNSEQTLQEVGGTSASSPAMAGIMALINQKSGAPQGSPNAELYKLASKQNYSSCKTEIDKNSSSCVFHDIDTGTINMACDYAYYVTTPSANCTILHSGDEGGLLSGYNATTGYDLATGLGSANVANLVNAFAANTTPLPVVTLSATALVFASTVEGQAAATQSVTLKNTGTGTLSISGITITGTAKSSFSEVSTCGTSLAAAASCSITVTFKPAATGMLTGAVSIADNASGAPQAITLTGTGVEPVASFSATTITFPATAVGVSATAQSVTLKNTGNVALAISKIALGGTNATSFSIVTNVCGASLSVGSSCAVTIGFKPTAAGTLTGTVTFTDNAINSPQVIQLKGTGDAPIALLFNTSLNFAGTLVGTSATSQTVTIKNTGNAALSLSSIAISGTNASSFSIPSKTCGTSLAAQTTCTVTVGFKPVSTGALTAALKFTDNATGSPQAVTLTGNGTDPAVQLSVTSITFAPTLVGTSAASQVVTIKNIGSAVLSISSIQDVTTVPYFEITGGTCGTTLVVNASCSITLGFKPLATGTFGATLKFTDNAPGSPQSVAVTAKGIAPAVLLSATSLTYPATTVGTAAAAQVVTIKNTGSAVLSISAVGLSGPTGNFSITGRTCGTSLVVNATCTVTVGFKPSAKGALSAALTFTDNAPKSPQSVALTGTGK